MLTTAFLVTMKALTSFNRKNSGVKALFCRYEGVNGVKQEKIAFLLEVFVAIKEPTAF